MTSRKRVGMFLSCLLVCTTLVGWLFFSRMQEARRVFLSPSQDAQALWQAREFGFLGTHEVLKTLPTESIFVKTFPSLLSYTFDQIVTYSGKDIESVDLILDQVQAEKLKLDPPDSWKVIYFDDDAAKKANGYYYEARVDHKVVWVQLSWIRTP